MVTHPGTQCELLSKDFDMNHVSAGELLRIERASGSSDGELIESYLKEGKIVPAHITLNLLMKTIETTPGSRFLIDGFPRNRDNVDGWEKAMPSHFSVDGVLFIYCAENGLVERILARGLTSGRSDDNLESVRKRLDTYRQSTLPILTYFEKLNKLIRVSGDGTIDQVRANIKQAVLPLLRAELIDIMHTMNELRLMNQRYSTSTTSTTISPVDGSSQWNAYRSHCIPDIITCLDATQVGSIIHTVQSS